MYLPRHIESSFQKTAQNFPITLLTGPRQVGKSTMLRHLADSDRAYVSLDDPIQREMARANPLDFLDLHPAPIIIDEIQYAPQLFPYLKMAVDSAAADNLYWITGSQVFSLMKGVSESLAGRVGVLRMPGFSQREETGSAPAILPFDSETISPTWIGAREVAPELAASRHKRILRGQFPRTITHQNLHPYDFYSSYVQTWLERDVMGQLNVKSSATFLQFVQLLASRSSQEFNRAELAKHLQIDAKTVGAWTEVLVASGLVYLLPSWSVNLGKRVVKRPKIYFLDTGLMCYLCGINDAETLTKSHIYGAAFETFVVGEVLRTIWNKGEPSEVFYYRDTSQKEIDLIVAREGKILPIEIKATSHPNHPFKNFRALNSANLDIPYWACICTAPQPGKIAANGWIIPDTMI